MAQPMLIAKGWDAASRPSCTSSEFLRILALTVYQGNTRDLVER